MFTPTPVGEDVPRFSLLLWGEAGCGKTTLAATAPGKKLWLLFDPDGDMSIKSYKDVHKLDMTTQTEQIVSEFKKADPFGLTKLLSEGGYDTLVVDSLTRASELALRFVIPTTYKASLENPTPTGYGARNLIVVNFMQTLLRLTRKLDKHIIFITHEGAPDKDEKGNTLTVTMMLGGQLPNLVAKDIGEVWHMMDQADTASKMRRVAVRPERLRTPMKSRIFDLTGTKTGFTWTYNPTTKQGITIESLWNQWKESGYGKVAIPG